MSLLKRTGAVFVALFLTLTLVAPQTARADATTDASVTNASKWIANTWKTKRSQFFAAGTTADGVIALSAANQEPDTVRDMLVDLKVRGPGYTDFDGGYPAGLAKLIMAADMAGQNPRTLFGCERDLVEELKAMVAGGPSISREYWGPYLIAIALTRSGEQVPAWVIDAMHANQQSGGFGYTENDGTFIADPDYTAIGISAMNLVAKNPKNAADRADALASISNAVAWSADPVNQKSDPNGYYWETHSSSNSTGMLASALGEVGVEITSPVRYLTSQQKADGGWAASHNGKKSDVMATTQAILGVIGEGYGTAHSTQVPEMVDCSGPTAVAPEFTTQPTSATVTAGDNASFTVTVTGTPTASLVWEKDVSGTWAAISGATSPTLTFNKVGSESNGLKVRAVATNSAGSTTSSVATLTVNPVVTPTPPVDPTSPETVYNTPGDRTVNGREWRTTCEKYSQTQRCRTNIKATKVTQVGGKFIATTDYVFNNLTYLPAPKSLWAGNPLGDGTTTWTANGRQWKTECNTPVTGNGCRSYIWARVVANVAKPGQPISYAWVEHWEFNNMVQYS